MVDIPAPENSIQYLTQQQLGLKNALLDDGFALPAKAYDAALKIIHLMHDNEHLGEPLFTNSMATCLVGHLCREIIQGLKTQFSESQRVEYIERLHQLESIWEENEFPFDGKIPPYKPEMPVQDGDLIFIKEPIEILSTIVQDHRKNYQSNSEKAKLLLREIYGERSDETEVFKQKEAWLKGQKLHKYAHINLETHANENADAFNEILTEFNALEALLAELAKEYYDKEDDLNEIIQQTNS